MTRITIDRKDDRIRLICEGHAGYARVGSDIVCAGISTLINAWGAKCQQMEEKGMITIDEMRQGPGFLILTIRGKGWEEAFSVVEIGLKLIEENFPQNLSLRGEK
jgi:uncharacterized protein YsxB (DUF464 family)